MSDELQSGAAPTENQFLENLRHAVRAGTASDRQRTLLARAIKTTLVRPGIWEDSKVGIPLFDELRALAWDVDANEEQRTELASALSHAAVAARTRDAARADELLTELRQLARRADATPEQRDCLAAAVFEAWRSLRTRGSGQDAEPLERNELCGARLLDELRALLDRADASDWGLDLLSMVLQVEYTRIALFEDVRSGSGLLDDLRRVASRTRSTPVQRSHFRTALYDGWLQAHGAGDGILARELHSEFERQSLAGHPSSELGAHPVLHERLPDNPDEQAEMLFGSALVCWQSRRYVDALRLFCEVDARFGAAAKSDTMKAAVSSALYNQGCLFALFWRSDKEIRAYDQLVAAFEDSSLPQARSCVAMALFNKAVREAQSGRLDAADRTHGEVVRRFGSATEPELRVQVAMALCNRGGTRGQLGRFHQEVQDYTEVISRFSGETEPRIRRQIAVALANRGATLGQLGRPAEGLRDYDEVIAQFAEDADPEIQRAVELARTNRANWLRAAPSAGALTDRRFCPCGSGVHFKACHGVLAPDAR